MRILHGILLSALVASAAACSAVQAATSVPPTAPIVSAYHLGAPVVTQLDAVVAALKGFDTPDFAWTEGPRTAFVEQMTYEQALVRLWGVQPPDDEFITHPRQTRVWMVIFQGRWTLVPMGPPGSGPLPYEGCLFRMLSAADGAFMAAGDAVCPTG